VCSFAADILGATELKGPVNFKYKDLKAATKNFSADNKLGEGGFGAVYKVNLCCCSFTILRWKACSKTITIVCLCF